MTEQLLQEIGQARPFVNRSEEAFLNLLRSAHILEQRLGRFLRGYKLSQAQYNALRILRGSFPEPLPCKEVGARMVTPMPDVTRLLDRLEARGLVDRSRSEEDRRVVEASITGKGLDLLAEIDSPIAQWMTSSLGHLGPDLDRLIRLLERTRTALA